MNYVALLGWGTKKPRVIDARTGEVVFEHTHYGTCVDKAADLNKKKEGVTT